MVGGRYIHAARFPMRRTAVAIKDALAPAPPSAATPERADLSILFVCRGNICRSTMAQGVTRAMLSRRGALASVAVESAGTSDYNAGRKPHWRARACMHRHRLNISDIRARPLSIDDFGRFDVIVGMDETVLSDARSLVDDASAKARVVLFAGGEVADPIKGDDAVFEDTYEQIAMGCQLLLDRLLGAAPE